MEQKLEQKLGLKGRMNKKIKVILLVVLILIIGMVVVYFSLKREKTYILKDYYPDIKQTAEYECIIKEGDTILHGQFVRYNVEGIIVAQGINVNGEPNGKSMYYFDDGIIESIHYRKNSKVTEESTYNYPSGKVREYLMYDDFGILDFLINYDELGNIKNYEGLPLIEIYQYKITNKRFQTKINQYLKVGDTLKYKYLIANIPNAKRSFKIENIGVDDSKVKRTFKKVSQVGIDVKEVLTKKGANTIRAIVKYEFKDKEKTVINDTISFDVNVH
ncbi:hypothetical protein OIU80_18855 [Flavobacterium sp. LS1R47]|uniref:MORN repeat protein n=1 Tax=Flavobacterium frigoritolerans TaxID=2987686 RepID=A0A9X3HN94_9FLAO|nr:hypothetical protein [Flavobacterium frigoritolerans]MCV9934344.1 hypothetical protein [Flavobacterium frigoritolerans]